MSISKKIYKKKIRDMFKKYYNGSLMFDFNKIEIKFIGVVLYIHDEGYRNDYFNCLPNGDYKWNDKPLLYEELCGKGDEDVKAFLIRFYNFTKENYEYLR